VDHFSGELGWADLAASLSGLSQESQQSVCMSHRNVRAVGDKAMIATLSFAIILMLALDVFDLVSMANHTFALTTGLKALASSLIFVLICHRMLRKRLDAPSK
jgi:hypothetical protein